MRLLPLPGVFQPKSDAWILANHLREERLADGAAVLDLCSGTGVLAIAAACHGASKVTAVDISARAVAAVKLNAWINGVSIEAIRGDLFAPIRDRRFDLIVSNPPYLPSETAELSGREPARAWEGGRSGRLIIERIAAHAREHLTSPGILLLVCSSVCGEERILEALRVGGLMPAVVLRQRGPLGPLLRARAEWLRRERLLLDSGEEEILLIRAPLAPARAAADSQRARSYTR